MALNRRRLRSRVVLPRSPPDIFPPDWQPFRSKTLYQCGMFLSVLMLIDITISPGNDPSQLMRSSAEVKDQLGTRFVTVLVESLL